MLMRVITTSIEAVICLDLPDGGLNTDWPEFNYGDQ